MQRRRQEESPCQSSLSRATVGTLNCMLIHVSGGRFKAWAAALTARCMQEYALPLEYDTVAGPESGPFSTCVVLAFTSTDGRRPQVPSFR